MSSSNFVGTDFGGLLLGDIDLLADGPRLSSKIDWERPGAVIRSVGRLIEHENMRKTSKTFLVVSELLFLFSLFLPAIENRVLGKVVTWEGWRTAFVAIWSLGDIANDQTLVVLGVAGLGNLVFVVAPLLLSYTIHAVALRLFCGAIVCALAFALWVPLSTSVGSPRLLVGYFVWLLAYAALLTSAIQQTYRHVRHQSVNT